MSKRNVENNFKGRAFIGIIVGITLVFLTAAAFAGCEGDCMSCHPKLIGDDTHIALTHCKTCHGKKSMSNSLFPKSGDGGCGTNCFDCHNQWPKDGNHVPLDTCKNCHK